MRLELTRRTDLALRALLELPADGSRVKGGVLAERIGATAGFLPQALAPLIERDWVRSEPGPTGGYRLAAQPTEVSVLELIEASEGETDTGRCVLVGDDCPLQETCALHEPWTRARVALTTELSATSVAEVRHRSHAGEIDPTIDKETSP